MLTGTIYTLRGHCNPSYTTFTFDSLTTDKRFDHDSSFVATVVAFQQPTNYPSGFSVANAGATPGLINHITEDFVIDTRYPQGAAPVLSSLTIAALSADAIAQINAAFGLTLA